MTIYKKDHRAALCAALLFMMPTLHGMHHSVKRTATKKYHRKNYGQRNACFDASFCYGCADVTLQKTNPKAFRKELSKCCAPAKVIGDILPNLIKSGDNERVAVALQHNLDISSEFFCPEMAKNVKARFEKSLEEYKALAHKSYTETHDVRYKDILTQLENYKPKNTEL